MNKIIALVVSLLITGISFSQENWCGTDYRDEIMKQQNSEEQLSRRIEVETAINQQAQHRFVNNISRADESKIIPVVVHIIHDNGTGDIDDAKVHDVIRTLNEDYRRLNPDSTETREMFLEHAGSMSYEFRLAQLDINGDPTTGIVRKSSSLTHDARDNVKGVSYWNSEKYFNIWVVNSIQGSGGAGTVLGLLNSQLVGEGV